MFFCADDAAELWRRWGETQFGRLIKDPAMDAFRESLRKSAVDRWFPGGGDGLIDDVAAVSSGAVAVAVTQPAEGKAVMLLIEVSSEPQAREVLAKVDQLFQKQGARSSRGSLNGREVLVLDLPQKKQQRYKQAVFFVHNGWLAATDNVQAAAELLRRMSGSDASLADAESYRYVMARAEQMAGGLAPDLRWHVDPFAYAKAMRTANGGKFAKGSRCHADFAESRVRRDSGRRRVRQFRRRPPGKCYTARSSTHLATTEPPPTFA